MYGFNGVHKHSVFSGYDFIDKLGRGLIDILKRFWKWLSKYGSCWEIFELDCEDVARVVRWIALGSGVCVSLYWWRFMYHNVLPFITYPPPLLLFTDFHLPPFYNWFLTIWDKKKYNYWMKSEIAFLWIIFGRFMKMLAVEGKSLWINSWKQNVDKLLHRAVFRDKCTTAVRSLAHSGNIFALQDFVLCQNGHFIAHI